MSQHMPSLIDVLMPPVNPWLRALARHKTNLPPGVRVVRFSEADDDTDEPSAVGASTPKSPTQPLAQGRPELANSEV